MNVELLFPSPGLNAAACLHWLHRTAKGSALDVGYANPQLDARIRKGSAR